MASSNQALVFGGAPLEWGNEMVRAKKVQDDSEALAAKDRNFVTALARGLELLRAFGPGDEFLGNAELSDRTGIPRPTVSRLTHTLIELGYLRYSERLEKYQLGAGVLALGYRYLANMGVREIARGVMQELADSTDCLVALGTPDRLQMTYIETCQGAGPLVLRLEIGSRIPMATSAMGRAYLAALSEERRDQYLAQFREAYPNDYKEIHHQIKEAVKQYRETGFCLSVAEWNSHISGVGVPLVLDGGNQILAFNCGGAALRLNRKTLEKKLGPKLVAMVRKVEEQMHGRRLDQAS